MTFTRGTYPRLATRTLGTGRALTREAYQEVPTYVPQSPTRGTRRHGLSVVADPDWKQRGACVAKEHDTELFYGDEEGRSTNGTRASNIAAKKVCARCDVPDECLAYALDHRERWGVWGGLTPKERDKILRAREEARLSTAFGGRYGTGVRSASSLGGNE